MSDDCARISRGPSRAPGRYDVPLSNGAPRIATSTPVRSVWWGSRMNVAGCAKRGLSDDRRCFDFMTDGSSGPSRPSSPTCPASGSRSGRSGRRPSTHSTVVAAMIATESRICQSGGPGWSAIRSSMRNGAAVGTSDNPIASVLSGARRMAAQVNSGTIRKMQRRRHHVLRVLEVRARRADGDEDRAEQQHRHQQEEQEPADHRGGDRIAVPVAVPPSRGRRRDRSTPAAATRRRTPISLPIIS